MICGFFVIPSRSANTFSTGNLFRERFEAHLTQPSRISFSTEKFQVNFNYAHEAVSVWWELTNVLVHRKLTVDNRPISAKDFRARTRERVQLPVIVCISNRFESVVNSVITIIIYLALPVYRLNLIFSDWSIESFSFLTCSRLTKVSDYISTRSHFNRILRVSRVIPKTTLWLLIGRWYVMTIT